MEFNVRTAQPDQARAGCVAVAVLDGRKLSPSAQALEQASKGAIGRALAGDLGPEPGATLILRDVPGVRAARVLLVRCAAPREMSDARFRTAARGACNAIGRTGTKDALVCLGEVEVAGRDLHWKVRAIVEAAEDATYRFAAARSKPESGATWTRVTIPARGRRDVQRTEDAIREGAAIAAGKALAKDLGNLPPNHCTPTYLAEQARELAKGRGKLRVKVIEEAEMRRLGMGALLAVAAGSRQPAKLIVIEYRGGRPERRPVTLVGKGVTFDSGGISLKPGANMDEMKFDMCGAASVLGTLRAASQLALPLNVVGIVPATENLPDGKATKPGDVVTSLSGQTVEILNTDAEGRLILCDALTYAERFEPEVVIDVATLTGACVVALGHHPSGLFSNHDGLGRALEASGEFTGDRAWPMPVWEEYQEALKSNFADMANVGGGRAGGAITAACFLARFTREYRWAHLDIAGTAWTTGSNKGASGRPVALLTQYLIDHGGRGSARKKRA